MVTSSRFRITATNESEICTITGRNSLRHLQLNIAVSQRRSIKKMFLKIPQNSQENTWFKVFFKKSCRCKVSNFIKEKLRHRYFPVEHLLTAASGDKTLQSGFPTRDHSAISKSSTRYQTILYLSWLSWLK